jgi:hypothetical protein
MGMHRFKKLAKKALETYDLAHTRSKFAEEFKNSSHYRVLRKYANDKFNEFETSLNKANKEYRSNLHPHQKSDEGFINWMHKNNYNVISLKVT